VFESKIQNGKQVLKHLEHEKEILTYVSPESAEEESMQGIPCIRF
jgi:hypothetical protein